jgi:hypothetical protein
VHIHTTIYVHRYTYPYPNPDKLTFNITPDTNTVRTHIHTYIHTYTHTCIHTYSSGGEGGAGAQSKYAEFQSLLKIVASGKQDEGGRIRGVGKGRRPLRGVFSEPQYGYAGM